MIKLFITARESNEDGTAVTLFEDMLLGYDDKDHILNDDELNDKIVDKIEMVEKVNNESATPF